MEKSRINTPEEKKEEIEKSVNNGETVTGI